MLFDVLQFPLTVSLLGPNILLHISIWKLFNQSKGQHIKPQKNW